MNYFSASLLALLCITAPAMANHEIPKIDIHNHHHHHERGHSKQGLAAVGAATLQVTEKHSYLTAAALMGYPIYKLCLPVIKADNSTQLVVVGGVVVAWYVAAGLYRTIAQAIMAQNDIKPLRD